MQYFIEFLVSLQPFLDWFFDLFKYEWIPVLLSIILIFVGLCVLIYFTFYKPHNLRKDLNYILNYLQSKFNKDGVTNRSIFYEQYPYLTDAFSKCKTLVHPWEEFDETLLKPDKVEVVKNTIRANAFFNDEIIDREINQRSMMGWPNIFVALGLLFTFIGLVAALKETSTAFDKNINLKNFPDYENTIVTKESLESEVNKIKNYKGESFDLVLKSPQGNPVKINLNSILKFNLLLKIYEDTSIEKALENLLKVATFKFVTSVVGILISVILLLVFRSVIRNLSNKISKLHSFLDSLLEFQPAERIQEQIFSELKRQTYPLEKFSEDLGVTLGKSMQPITEAIHGLAEKLSTLNQEGLNDMIEKFFKSASGETKDMMENLTERLNEVGQQVSNMTTGMNQSGESFTSKVTDSTEKLQIVINELSTKLEEQTRIIEDFSNSTSNVSSSLDATASGFNETADKLDSVSDKMGETFSNLENSITALSSLRENLSTLVNQMSQATESMQSTWSTYEQRFQAIDTSLENAGQKFSEVIVARQQDALGHIQTVSESMNKAVSTLSGAIADLDNSILDLRETMTNNTPPPTQT